MLVAAFGDLGGHDPEALCAAYREADLADVPTVVFAHTVKGWGLPMAGHPANHSALLDGAQMDALAARLGADRDAPWEGFAGGSPAADLCRRTAERLRRHTQPPAEPPPVPVEVTGGHPGRRSTQQALGRILDEVCRREPDLARAIVTVSPDVATSTGLAGWIAGAGVWDPAPAAGDAGDDAAPDGAWVAHVGGQHIELGIAETNLMGLLGELGLTWERCGRPLLPLGTVYDPFVARALEPWSFAMYAGGQMILVGTPSGVTLAPEGGAHQSVVTPSIGVSQPGCVAWEPAFAQDLEWCLLHALSRIGRPGGESAYLRLSTLPVDQSLARIPADDAGRAARREGVLRGAYRLSSPAGGQVASVTLVGMGAAMPAVVAAARRLDEHGAPAEVLCVTSADLVFRAIQARRGLIDGDDAVLEVFDASSAAPVVAVLDGHPHALSFLGGLRPSEFTCLGVHDFGQSGDVHELHAHHGIDAETVIGAALDLLR